VEILKLNLNYVHSQKSNGQKFQKLHLNARLNFEKKELTDCVVKHLQIEMFVLELKAGLSTMIIRYNPKYLMKSQLKSLTQK
jgi:hypothetical protein